MPNNSESILTTKNLSVGYSSHVLFQDVDVSLEQGKLTCFMGQNGVGKSTLLRTLAGLQKPLAGEISSPSQKNIAVVLTDKISAAQMTVFDLVSYGRYPHLRWGISFSEYDHQIVKWSMEEVHIMALKNKKIDQLSDGQLQLVMVARALAQETPILLLDEPTAHLDLNNRVDIMRLLLKLSRKNKKAILIATHELDLALQMADKVWLATHEKKIKTGIPEDLVLDNSFDEIFQFKGFDLKTGKLEHEPFRLSVRLSGSGHEFLWTKNALEREGFSVSASGPDISIEETDGKIFWRVDNHAFQSVSSMLEFLKAS